MLDAVIALIITSTSVYFIRYISPTRFQHWHIWPYPLTYLVFVWLSILDGLETYRWDDNFHNLDGIFNSYEPGNNILSMAFVTSHFTCYVYPSCMQAMWGLEENCLGCELFSILWLSINSSFFCKGHGYDILYLLSLHDTQSQLAYLGPIPDSEKNYLIGGTVESPGHGLVSKHHP